MYHFCVIPFNLIVGDWMWRAREIREKLPAQEWRCTYCVLYHDWHWEIAREKIYMTTLGNRHLVVYGVVVRRVLIFKVGAWGFCEGFLLLFDLHPYKSYCISGAPTQLGERLKNCKKKKKKKIFSPFPLLMLNAGWRLYNAMHLFPRDTRGFSLTHPFKGAIKTDDVTCKWQPWIAFKSSWIKPSPKK